MATSCTAAPLLFLIVCACGESALSPTTGAINAMTTNGNAMADVIPARALAARLVIPDLFLAAISQSLP